MLSLDKFTTIIEEYHLTRWAIGLFVAGIVLGGILYTGASKPRTGKK